MSTSSLQQQVAYLFSESYDKYAIVENYRPDWMISSKGERLELDFYIKELFIAIEVQGEQHYRFVPHFHGDYIGFKEQQRRDEEKRTICKECGIALFEIGDEVDLKDTINAINAIVNGFKLEYPDSMRKIKSRKERIKKLSALIIKHRDQLEKTKRNLLEDDNSPERMRRLRCAIIQSEMLLIRYQALLEKNVSRKYFKSNK